MIQIPESDEHGLEPDHQSKQLSSIERQLLKLEDVVVGAEETNVVEVKVTIKKREQHANQLIVVLEEPYESAESAGIKGLKTSVVDTLLESRVRKLEQSSSYSVIKRASSKESVVLSSKPPLERQASLEGRFRMQESWSSVECRRRSASTDRAALHLHASQEEVCTGFWSTMKGESTRKTMLQKAKSMESMSFKTKSATSTSTELRSDLEKSSVGLGTSKEIAVQRRDIVAAAFGISTHSLERLLNVVEAIDWENITMLDSQKERLSVNLQALTSSPVSLNIPSVLGRIVAPAEQEANIDLIMRDRTESKVFAQLRASADEVTSKEVSLGTMSELEQAAFMSLLITAVSRCDLRTIAARNVAATTEIFYDVAEEKMSASGVMRRESRRDYGSKTFTSSREEVVQGFWKGERDEERVVKTLKTRMEDFKQTLNTRSATFISETATLGLRKADQNAATSGVQKLGAKEVISEAFGITEKKMDQFFEILEQMDWINIELGQREHAAISANIRILSDEQQNCSGILGKLRPPKQQEETTDVRLEDSQKANTILTVRAACQSTISSNSNFSRSVSDSEKAVFSNLVSVLASHDLSTIATSSEASIVSIGYQNIPETLEASKSWKVSSSERLNQQIREPSEQVVQSFWNTASDEEKIAVFVAKKVDSIYESLNAVAASMANESVIRDLVRTVQSSGTATVRHVTLQEFVSSAFGISSSSLQKFFEVLEKMDWSQVNLPVAQHSAITSNVKAFAPPNFNSSSILGKLRPPAPEESSVDLKVGQAQKATCILNVKETLDSTITSSESFSRIPDAEKTIYSNLIGIMATDDFSTIGSSSESKTVEVNYSEAMKRLDASRSVVAKNLAVLESELRESSEEVVQGFWSTASDEEKIGAVVSEKLKSIHHSLQTHAVRTVTESLSRDIGREEQSGMTHHFVKLSAREVVQAAFGVSSESVDQMLSLLEKMDWSQISLVQPIHSNIAANVRALAKSSSQSSGVLGKLIAPQTAIESTSREIQEVNRAKCILNVMSLLNSAIAVEPSISKIPEEERATFSNIVGLIASDKLLTSSESSTSSFGFDNVVELSEARKVIHQANHQSLKQKILESTEELVQGIWNTATEDEKKAIVVKEKLSTVHQSLNTLAIQMATESVSRELIGSSESLGIVRSVHLPTLEVVRAAFGISQETVRNLLEVMAKIEWSSVSLPAKERHTISGNVRALAESKVDVDNILAKLVAPEPQMESADRQVTESRRAEVAARLKSAVESVICQDSHLSRIPAQEQTVIINLASLMVSHDLTSLSATTSEFGIQHVPSEKKFSAEAVLSSPLSQQFVERVREPIEQNVSGFWNTASNTQKKDVFLKERSASIHATLQTFATSLTSETMHREFTATAQCLTALQSIRLTPREILCAAFGISTEQVDEVFRALDSISWAEIYLPVDQKETLNSNLRLVNADVPNVFGQLMSRPEEHQETSTVRGDHEKLQFLLNVQKRLEESTSITSSLLRSSDVAEAQTSNVISILLSESLGQLISQAVQLAQPNLSDESTATFQIPRQVLLDRVLPEASEESVQSFWKSSQLSESTNSTFAEKFSKLKSEFVISAAKQVSTSLTLDYRRKVFNQNSEIIFGDLTRDVVCAAFAISSSTLDEFFSHLEQLDWSQVELTAKQKSIISANVTSLASSQLDALLGKLLSKPEEQESTERSFSKQSRLEVKNTFKIQQILLESSLQRRRSEVETATFSNLVALLSSVDLKAAIQVATFDRAPESLSADASIIPVTKLQQFVRQPEEQVIQGTWSNEKQQKELVEHVCRKIEVLRSMLTCYAVTETHKDVAQSLERADVHEEVYMSRGVPEIVRDAFAVSNQSYFKILKVLGHMESVDIPEKVKETLAKNLAILNLPPVETLIQFEQQAVSIDESVQDKQLAKFLFSLKSALDSEIGVTTELTQILENEEATATRNLAAVLASIDLSTVLQSPQTILQPQRTESDRSVDFVRDDVNILRHDLQSFAVEKTSSEVSRVIEIIRSSQNFHLVHTTMLEEIKTIQIRMEVLKRVLMNQVTAEELLHEAFQSSEQQMETFQRIVEEVHWEETRMTEEIVRNLRNNFVAIPRFEGVLSSLTAPPEERKSTETSIQLGRRAEAVQNLMAAADNVIATTSSLSTMNSDERLLHKTILKTMAVCDLTTPASTSEFQSMTQGFYQKIEESRTEQKFAEKLHSRAAIETSETTDESVHGVWSSRKEKESSEKILKASEMERTMLTTLASAEEESSIYSDLAAFGSKEQIGKLVSMELRDIVQSSFGISEQSLEKLFELIPKMDWSNLTMPLAQKQLVVKNLTLLLPAEARLMESVGTIQAPPEEEAFAELDLKQAREAKVMMDIQECVSTTCTGYSEMNRPQESEITSYSALLGTMSICDLVTMAASNIQVDSKYDYYRRPAPKDAETIITGINADSLSFALREAGEAMSSGIWSTVSTSETARTTISEKMVTVSSARMATQAASDEVITQDQVLAKINAQAAERKVAETRKETLGQRYSIDRSESNVQLQAVVSTGDSELKTSIPRAEALSQSIRSQDHKDLQFEGSFGELEAPLPQEEDVETTFRQSRTYRSSSQIRAPSEESIQRTEALRRSESAEFSAKKTILERNRESLSLSRKASVERETSMEARVSRMERSESVERLQKIKSKEATSSKVAESSNTTVEGSWVTSKPPIGAKVSIPTRKVEKEVTSATMTVASASVECDVGLEKDRTEKGDAAGTLVRAKSIEEVEREFGVEVTSTSKILEKREQIESWIKSMPTTVEAEGNADFRDDEIQVGGVMGTLNPRREQEEELEKIVEVKRSASQTRNLKAATNMSVEEADEFSRTEADQQIETIRKELILETGTFNATATKEVSATAKLEYAKLPSEDITELSLTESRRQSNAGQFKETKEEEVVGLWKTASKGEIATKILAHKPPIDTAALKAKAAKESTAAMSGSLQKSPSAETFGVISQKIREETDNKFGIAQGSAEATLKSSDVSGAASHNIIISNTGSTSGSATQFSKQEAGVGFGAANLMAPAPEHAEAEHTQQVTQVSQVTLSKRAAGDSGAQMETRLQAGGDSDGNASFLRKVPSTEAASKDLLASKDSVITVDSIQSRDSVSDAKRDLQLKASNLESQKLRLVETREEESGLLVRSSNEYEETQKTLRDRSVSRETMSRNVVAPSTQKVQVTLDKMVEPSVAERSLSIGIVRETSISEVMKHAERTSELTRQSLNEEVAGVRSVSETRTEEFRARQQGDAEVRTGAAMGRIEAPRPQRAETEVTQKLKRTLSVERTTRASETVESQMNAQIQKREDSLTSEYSARETVLLKSSSVSHIATEQMSEHLVLRSKSEHHISEKIQERLCEKQSFSSQEFITENQGMHTHWDVIDNNGEALICWKSKEMEKGTLDAKTSTESAAGTTLDLTVRRPGGSDEELVAEHLVVGVSGALSISETRADMEMTREDAFFDDATYVASDILEEHSLSTVHEFGESEASTTFGIGKLVSKKSEKEEVDFRFADSRKLRQSSEMTAVSETTTEMDSDILRLPECDQSAKLISQKIQQKDSKNLKATVESTADKEAILEKRDIREQSVDVKKLDKRSVHDSKRVSEPRNENALSQYTSDVVDLEEKTVIPLTRQDSTSVMLKAVQTSRTDREISIDRGEANRMTTKNVMQRAMSRASEERRFQIQMTKSEKMLKREDSFDESEFVTSMSLRDEVTSGTFHEFGDASVEVCTLFGKIVQKKFEVEEIEEVLPVIRRWVEVLSIKAVTSVEVSCDNKISKPESEATSQKKLKTANSERHGAAVNATHEEVMSASTVLESRNTREDVASIRLRDKSRERVAKKYQENQWNLLSTNAEWETLLNDLEESVTIAQSVQDSMTFSAKAAASVNLTNDATIRKSEATFGIQKSISQSNVDKTMRQFSSANIENELLVTKLGMDLEEIEKLVDEINREQAVGGRIREFGRSETGGGIYLVRRALPKVKETSTHTVTLATSFRQIFSTMSAGDEISEANVELTIPSNSVGAEISSCVARSDSMTFSTSHASEYTATTVADYSRDIAVSASTAARKKAVPVERFSHKLKEVGADGVEILSLWEGIETDLDASTQLVDLLKVTSSLQTIESTEEVERINQYLEMPEEKGLVIHLITVQNKDICQRNFSVAICSLDTAYTRKFEISPTYSVSKVLTEKRVVRETWRVTESGNVRFNAVINLHRYSLSKPTLAQETVLREVVRIAAQPLFISAGDIESDVVWSTHQLQKTAIAEQTNRTIVGARKGDRVKIKLEESGDEKVKLKVDLLGGVQPAEFKEASWKIARAGEAVKFETEEFEIDECLFYGQINCKQTHFEDKDISIKVPRVTDLNLTAKACTEETSEVTESWSIPDKAERSDKLIIIANVGHPTYMRTKESSEEIVGVGIAYNVPEENLVSAIKLQEKASGGLYELNTKAAGDEYKMVSSSLLRTQQVEKVKGKMVQKVIAKEQIRVLETTTEAINANFNYEIPEQNLKIGTVKACSNNAAPFTVRLHECLDFYVKMFYNLNKKDDFESLIKTFIISNGIEPKSLSCAAADYIESTRNPEFNRPADFSELQKTVVDFNRIDGAELSTFEPITEKIALGTMLSRQEKAARVEHIVKDKNRGSNLKFKFLESREEKQTVYNTFEVDAEKEKTERTIDLVRQGGHFKLSTDAAEDHEIIVHREISKPIITHHDTLQCFTLSNSAPHQSLSTSGARQELQTVSAQLSKPAEWQAAELLVVSKNIEQPVKWRVLECEECVENVHPIYRRPDDIFDLDEVWHIARNGGKFERRCKASGDEKEIYDQEIKSRGVKDDKVDRKFIVGNKEEPISLKTFGTSTVASTVSQDMSRLGEKEAIKRVMRHSNKGINVEKTMIEATEHRETISEQFRRNDQFDKTDLTIKDRRTGGVYELSTNAAELSSSSMSGALFCPRPSELSVEKTFITSQTIIPAVLNCRAAEIVGHTVTEHWNRPNAFFGISKIIKDCNRENEQFTFREAGEEYHTTNCFYTREQEDKTVAKTLHEARLGVPNVLDTKHATDRSADAAQHLEKARLAESGAEKLFVIGNTSEPAVLTTKATTVEQHNQVVDLKRPAPYHQVEILKQGANLGIPTYFRARESTSKVENVATQLIRKDEKLELDTVRKTPLLAEPVTFDTNASKSHSIILDKSLTASGDFELDAVVVIVDKNTETPQFFRCSCTKEASTSAAASLSAGSKSESCKTLRVAANRGQPTRLVLRESSSVQETNNVHYQRDEHHEHVSETKAYPRYGGKFALDTKASTAEDVRIEKHLEKKADRELQTERKTIIRNEAAPVEIFVSATEESAAGLTTSLSRANPWEAANVKLKAANKGEPAYWKAKETTDFTETNNVQLRREEEHLEKDIVIKIAASGGSSLLRAGFADEKFVDAETKLSREAQWEGVQTVRKIGNEEKRNLSIGASQETSVNLDETVTCRKSSAEEVTLTKEAKNIEPHVFFRSTEASDMAIGIHYSLRNSEKVDETEEIKKIARNGGSSSFSCFAAGEESPDSVSAYLTREGQEESAEKLFPTPMLDSLKFNSTAAEEFAAWNTTSFRRKDHEEEHEKVFKTSETGEHTTLNSKASQVQDITLDADLHFGVGYKEHRQVTKDEANVGEGTGMHSGASEETIFNLGYDYCKQPTEFTTVCVTEDKLLIQGAYGFRAAKEESITLDADLHFGVSYNDLRAMGMHASNNEIEGTGMRSTASEETVFNLAYDYCKQPTEFRTVFISEDHQFVHGAFGFRAVGEERIEMQVLELEARMVEVMVEGSVHNLARRHEDEPFVLYTEVAEETIIRVDERIEKKTTVVESEQTSEVKMREKGEERRKEEKR